jgi:hypothetical protein
MELIPTTGPTVFDLIAALTTLRQQAIIRPTNPPPGIAGFLFDVPDEEEINARADITDNFVEANFAVQDHIALKPEEYTVRGFVAELVAFQPQAPATATTENQLPLNPNITPQFTLGAEETQALIDQIRDEQDETAGENTLWEFYTARSAAPPDETRQTRAFRYFHALMRARQLFTVETPWGFFYPVAIQHVRAAQGPETKGESTFALTFKVIRIAGAVTVAAGQLAGRAFQQSAAVTQNGTAGKVPIAEEQRQSLIYRFTHGP